MNVSYCHFSHSAVVIHYKTPSLNCRFTGFGFIYYKISSCSASLRVLSLGLVWIPFFELRSFGIINTEYSKLRREGAEHFLLSNKSRNLCAYVCLFAFLVCREPFIQWLHAWRVCCCGLKGVQCRILVQYGHATCSELINYRTARARSGALHAGRAYMLRERNCTSDTKHTVC